MFDFLKKKQPAPSVSSDVRDTLFGDMPVEAWPATPIRELPWLYFVEGQEALRRGDVGAALEAWKKVVETPGLEGRQYAQAWHFMRQHGVGPGPARAKELLGVIFEVGMEHGMDVLAAYPEKTARYYNYTGAGMVWERPDDRFDGLVEELLARGQVILDAIGPWEGPRRTELANGMLRINLLSPSGLHFGEGPFEVLSRDPMATPAVKAATALMNALVEFDLQRRGKA